MTKRVKSSDVQHLRLTYRAQARCDGHEGAGCRWQPFAAGDDREVRRQAREHVQFYPGHDVVVTVADVTRYYLPKDLVAELTVETPAANGDDQPDTLPESKED